MYRTRSLRDLILKGIPASLRRDIWMISSGAINDVRNTHFLAFTPCLK